MKLVIGLGNPGKRYEKTRHNVGFMVADALASKMVNGQKWSMVNKFQSLIINHQSSTIFAKPQTMMNDSGKAVVVLATFYKLPDTDIYVIHDDLDIALGEYKIQKGKGPRDHNGLSSIDKALGTREYWHVRIGIENRFRQIRNPKFEIPSKARIFGVNKFKLFNFPNFKRRRIPGEKFVLQSFTKDELEIVDQISVKVAQELKDNVLVPTKSL